MHHARVSVERVVGFFAVLGLSLAPMALGQAITEFPLPPGVGAANIVAGPDGSLWFTGHFGLGRMTTLGVFTQIPVGDPNGTGGLVFDTAGNLWFSESVKIGRLSPDGVVVEFDLPLGLRPYGIAAGPDGNIWFTSPTTQEIGRMASSGSVSRYVLSANPYTITAGSDGNLWFIESGDQIGRISPTGSVMEFAVPGSSADPVFPSPITSGPDGALWFTNRTGKIGRITTSGSISQFTISTTEMLNFGGITSGPDGNIWFTYDWFQNPRFHTSETIRVGRVTPDGTMTETLLPTPAFAPNGIAAGRDGNLWVAESAGKIVRVSPTATTCGQPGTLCLNAGRFRVSATWQSPSAAGGGTSILLTSNTGAFWFFDPTNLELVVKVLDGRSVNGKWWVFYGSLTNVEFTLTVTDTQTGAVKTYVNPLGQLASVADTSAF